MSGELSALSRDRHPWDWYVEQHWVTEALADRVDLGGGTIADPCCGMGMIPDVFAARGHHVIASDIENRGSHHQIGSCDFLDRHPEWLIKRYSNVRRLSFVFNSPYSYQGGQKVTALAERFVRRALQIADAKVCALLPVKWLASEGRYRLFAEHAPEAIHIFCERPSMPPGNIIAELGKKAWKRGKVDYCWIVWDARARPMFGTPTFWIPPRAKEARA